LHYFGPCNDPEGALQKYLDQEDDLHDGRRPRLRNGPTVTERGNPILDPLLNAELMLKKRLIRWLSELGLLPTIPTRIKVSGDSGNDDPLLELMPQRQEHLGGN
jgi:hypothetical protein